MVQKTDRAHHLARHTSLLVREVRGLANDKRGHSHLITGLDAVSLVLLVEQNLVNSLRYRANKVNNILQWVDNILSYKT